MSDHSAKNLVIFFTEIVFILLMVFGILPREASFVITGLLVFYFLFSPLEDSLWVFIASIPLFVALPVTETFDSMANWRLLLAVLFLVLFFRQGISIYFKKENRFWRLKEKFIHEQMEHLALVFLVLCCLSLLVARDSAVGLKKIAFLVNACLLYVIIRNVIFKNPEASSKILSAMKTAIGVVLAVGYLQLLSVFFAPLYVFWQFWAQKIIPIFYGQNLGELLTRSNTWFSYYAYQLPTLRMFSVFPDSHSFAFFCVLSLPIFLCLIFLRSDAQKRKRARYYLLLILCLLAILFSGSRGAWASALIALMVFASVLFFVRFFHAKSISRKEFSVLLPLADFLGFSPQDKNNKQKHQVIICILGALIIFFLLMPISSGVLLLSQSIQSGWKIDLSQISLFERAKSITDIYETSAKSRLEIWRRSVDSLAQRPILGVGIGNYPIVLNEDLSTAKKGSSAHNLYLDIASETGVFAAIVLIVIFCQILKKAWLVFRNENDPQTLVWSGFFVLALLWVLSYSLFDVVLINDKVLLFFMANLALLYVPKTAALHHHHSDL